MFLLARGLWDESGQSFRKYPTYLLHDIRHLHFFFLHDAIHPYRNATRSLTLVSSERIPFNWRTQWHDKGGLSPTRVYIRKADEKGVGLRFLVHVTITKLHFVLRAKGFTRKKSPPICLSILLRRLLESDSRILMSTSAATL